MLSVMKGNQNKTTQNSIQKNNMAFIIKRNFIHLRLDSISTDLAHFAKVTILSALPSQCFSKYQLFIYTSALDKTKLLTVYPKACIASIVIVFT